MASRLFEVQVLDVGGRGLQDGLQLPELLDPQGILGVAAVARPLGRLDVDARSTAWSRARG